MRKILCFFLLLGVSLSWDALVARYPSPEAQKLYQRLQASQSNHIISGQFAYWDNLKQVTGKTPVIQGFDFQNYSPHNPWHDDWSSWDDGTVQNAINFHKNTGGKGIVTFHWHWFSPTEGWLRTSTFYTQNTGFDVSKAVIPGTAEYIATIRDIDAIADLLRKLRDLKIPVLWRPLHEAGGKWFWWGAKGPEACKALWNLMFDRLNNRHQLNNLIWVWSTPELDWYPGKNTVDIIGYDSYPGNYNYNCQLDLFMQHHKIVGGSKLIALTENGPIPNIDQCLKDGANWNFFMSWSDLVVYQNDQNHLKEVYNNPKVYTLENIPA